MSYHLKGVNIQPLSGQRLSCLVFFLKAVTVLVSLHILDGV